MAALSRGVRPLAAGVGRPSPGSADGGWLGVSAEPQEALMNGYGDSPRDYSRRGTRDTAVIVASGRRLVRIRRSSGRKLRDLPELDLRTPSGRLLRF
jgi:hypothetical protein